MSTKWSRFAGGGHTFETATRPLELQEKYEAAETLQASGGPTGATVMYTNATRTIDKIGEVINTIK